jgi:serine/threonine-protein kinase
MSIAAGARLGPYEILSPLGAGGMGEVYRARDTRLERTVAVKVLPAHLSVSAESRQRFEREAKTISQLSHPHICALYDVGNQDGVEFLVMEYLEGETLSDRLLKGALSFEQVLRYGIEIADALDKAHRQGIVHRDLKPGNVMITKSGVKLLDFGLAKAIAPTGRTSGASLTALPTQAGTDLTAEGTILGTFQYMAPEQLEGKEADARTDIFAFGAVLYEMATGRKAFSGKSQASLISSIMGSQPLPVSSIAPMTPPAFDRVVRTCLAKDPEDRWQTAHDVMLELRWVAEAGSAAGLPAPIVAKRKTRDRVVWGAAGLALGIALASLATFAFFRGAPAPRAPNVRFAINLPADQALPMRSRMLAISPDGSQIVWVGGRGESRKLFVRSLDRLSATAIPGTEGADLPLFSPDGRWILFQADGKLKKVPIGGGEPVVLARASFLGATWLPDGMIVYPADFTSGLYKVSANGGESVRLTTPDPSKKERAHIWPSVLPDGRTVLHTIWTGGSWSDARIAALDIATGKSRVVLEGGSDARYVPTGHILYVRGGSLLAVPFDPKKAEVTGPAVTVLAGVLSSVAAGEANYALSEGGTLAYVPGGRYELLNELVWVDRHGAVRPIPAPPKPYAAVDLSPDGRRVTFTIESSTFDVWIYDLERGTLTRLSFGEDDSVPRWSPDGKYVVFTSSRGGAQNLFRRAADASGPEERLTTSPHHQWPATFTPDGRTLLFVQFERPTGFDIWALPLNGDRKATPVLRGPYRESLPSLSPDGRWLAYVSDESGDYQVYVQPFPGPGGKTQISVDGGSWPIWARDGGTLFYRKGDKFWSIAIQTSPSFTASRPALMFQGEFGESYDIAPDGQRFLTTRKKEDPTSGRHINVFLGWFDELKRRVPTGKR